MYPTEDEQSTKRKPALLLGQIAGFASGLVVALLLETDSRITAVSGMVLGAAAGFWFQAGYSLWIKLGVALVSILSVAFIWWPY